MEKLVLCTHLCHTSYPDFFFFFNIEFGENGVFVTMIEAS